MVYTVKVDQNFSHTRLSPRSRLKTFLADYFIDISEKLNILKRSRYVNRN